MKNLKSVDAVDKPECKYALQKFYENYDVKTRREKIIALRASLGNAVFYANGVNGTIDEEENTELMALEFTFLVESGFDI